jgi:purine-cytosine permease-like protein
MNALRLRGATISIWRAVVVFDNLVVRKSEKAVQCLKRKDPRCSLP